MDYKALSHRKSNVWMTLILMCFAYMSCKQEVIMTDKDENRDPVENEPFVYEKDLMEKGEKFPVDVEILVYEAPQLPVGDYYRNASQLGNAMLTSRLHLTMGARSTAELKEDGIMGKLDVVAAEDRDFFDLEIALKLDQIELNQRFFSKYAQPVYFEIADNESVKVIVISVMKKGWIQMPLSKQEAEDPQPPVSRIRPIKLAKSDNSKRATEVKVRYYPLAQLMYDAEEFYKLKKIAPDVSWEGCDVGDDIVDATPWFQDTIGEDNAEGLWVYYNISKRLFISKADIYLDASLRHFMMKSREDAPFLARLSGEILLVDARVKNEIEDLKKLEIDGNVRRLAKFSKLVQSGCETKLALADGRSISLELIADDHWKSAHLLLEYEGVNRSFNMTDTLLMDTETVQHCGLSDGEEKALKTILVLKSELIDSMGRVVKLPPENRKLGRIESNFEKDDEDPFSEVSEEESASGRYSVPADFEQLISIENEFEEGVDPFKEHPMKRIPLTIPPEHYYFNKSDLVKDLTLPFSRSVPLKKGHRVYLNLSRNELCVFADRNTLDMVEQLVLSGCHLPRRQYRTHVAFYEVDSKSEWSQDWDMTMIALSNPKILASGGIVSSSGERGEIALGKSKIELESVMGDDGYTADQSYKIDLKSELYSLKKSLRVKCNLDFPNLIELENNGKRSVVMVIEMENGMSDEQRSRALRMMYGSHQY